MLERLTDSERDPAPPAALQIRLTLPLTPPYDWPVLVAFLAPRATPGVEIVSNAAYTRTIALCGAHGTITVNPADQPDVLVATIRFPLPAALPVIERRIRLLFDLDADPALIGAHLSSDPLMARLVAARPGLRVPGAWDAFELAVRAILGQQISVGRATALAGKLVALCGTPLAPAQGPPLDCLTRLFPTPTQLANVDDLGLALGMPRARAAAITALARAASADPNLLEPARTLEESTARLRALPGIGEWTAQYIAMRAWHLPDAFPHSDIGLLRAMQTSASRPTPSQLLACATAWRPWRAYAAMHLWSSTSSTSLPSHRRKGNVV